MVIANITASYLPIQIFDNLFVRENCSYYNNNTINLIKQNSPGSFHVKNFQMLNNYSDRTSINTQSKLTTKKKEKKKKTKKKNKSHEITLILFAIFELFLIIVFILLIFMISKNIKKGRSISESSGKVAEKILVSSFNVKRTVP